MVHCARNRAPAPGHSSIVFDNVRHHLYDVIQWMDFTHALSGTVALLRDHAVFAGLSTGATYLAATHEARRHPDRLHLVIGADTGNRYVEHVHARHTQALEPSAPGARRRFAR